MVSLRKNERCTNNALGSLKNYSFFKNERNDLDRSRTTFKSFVWTNLRKTIVLYWTDEFSERFWNNGRFLLNERFFRTNFKKRINERFHLTNVLLNERIYWPNVQWENEQNRWKMNDNFENEQDTFFWTIEKNRTKWVVQERCTNGMKKAGHAHLYS